MRISYALAVAALSMLALPAAAGTVLLDDFDDGSLDSAWSVSLSNATGWTYSESGSELTVTDIAPTVVNSVSYGTVAGVTLSRSFTELGDFDVDVDISWDSESSVAAMQHLLVGLYDADGNLVAGLGGYRDGWVQHAGGVQAIVGSDATHPTAGSLALAGDATIGITRTNGAIDFLWDGTSLASGTSTTGVSRIDLILNHYAYDGSSGTSFFGSESVDRVSVSGVKVVPLPPAAWLGLGLLGGMGLVRRLRRRRR